MNPLDKIGQEITPGSVIAYGHALNRSAGLRLGKVLAVTPHEKKWNSDSGWAITVLGIDDDWVRPGQEFPVPKLNTRKGTLQYPNRTVVVDPSKLPQFYQDLFASVEMEK